MDDINEDNTIDESISKVLNSSTRRSIRERKATNRYTDFINISPAKRRQQYHNNSEHGESSEEDEISPKLSALFTDDDVEGQDIFRFKSRHSRNDMQLKVQATIRSSPIKPVSSQHTPKRTQMSIIKNSSLEKGKSVSPMKKSSVNSPMRRLSINNSRRKLNLDSPQMKSVRNSPVIRDACEATPKHVKEKIKKRITREVQSASDDGDFSSSSSSNYVPDECGNDSEATSYTTSENDEESESDIPEIESPKVKTKFPVKCRRDTKTKQNDKCDYVVVPDNFFMMNSSKKITTSDHTLARLKNLNSIDDSQQFEIYLTDEHKDRMKEMHQSYSDLFDKWCFAMSENYNIILNGLGSKRTILQQFQAEKLQDFPCIVIDGFYPSLTIKQILDGIIIDLFQYSSVPKNVRDIVNLIDKELTENNDELFLIIHNIDGTMLRNAKAQDMLASISQIKRVHTLASSDHINAPILWNPSRVAKFNFLWWDVTTFIPYIEETSYGNSLMSRRTDALQLSSLQSVYQSLTTNGKGIFDIIIKNQLCNEKQSHYQGLPFKELYSKAREQFLVSSTTALRTQLVELLDHKLVEKKMSVDGSENLLIPIDNTLLQQYLEQREI